MNKLETLTTHSSSLNVLECLTSDDLFSPDKVMEFAQIYNPLTDIFDYNSLKTLVDSELFRERFKSQWNRETDSMWKGRTASIAIKETILHTTASLAEDAQLALTGKSTEYFSNLTQIEIFKMGKRFNFLKQYYRSMLKGAP